MSVRGEEEVNRVFSRHGDMVRRLCLLHLRDRTDTEDIFQNVFLKYILYSGAFESPEHERAWFIRITLNACKDHLKFLSRHPTLPLECLTETERTQLDGEQSYVLEAVLALPTKYKQAVYLHYYEGYTAAEIGRLLGRRENTIYSLLARGRQLLKKRLEVDGDA